MSADLLFLVPLLLVLAAVVLWRQSRRRRLELGLPDGVPVYQDTRELPGSLLFSARCGLVGRPDLLIEAGAVIIPVEVKTGSSPAYPYPNHLMQLMVYCVLVEENYGVRPPFGLLRYADQQFEIDFTPERENELLALVAQMRAQRQTGDLHRSHTNGARCAACGYLARCDEQLPQQLSLDLFG